MTDQQLQLALAKMLPEIIRADFGTEGDDLHFEWLIEPRLMRVRDTEWLHICWLVEQTLVKDKLNYAYSHFLYNVVVPFGQQPCMASWQQRAEALCKVKGITP